MLSLESLMALLSLCLACYQKGYQDGSHEHKK